jgi:hypothetical protein
MIRLTQSPNPEPPTPKVHIWSDPHLIHVHGEGEFEMTVSRRAPRFTSQLSPALWAMIALLAVLASIETSQMIGNLWIRIIGRPARIVLPNHAAPFSGCPTL